MNRTTALMLLSLLSVAAAKGVTQPEALSANKVFDDLNNSYCYVHFEAEAPTDADYFLGLWLMPAQYANGDYTNFPYMSIPPLLAA